MACHSNVEACGASFRSAIIKSSKRILANTDASGDDGSVDLTNDTSGEINYERIGKYSSMQVWKKFQSEP